MANNQSMVQSAKDLPSHNKQQFLDFGTLLMLHNNDAEAENANDENDEASPCMMPPFTVSENQLPTSNAG